MGVLNASTAWGACVPICSSSGPQGERERKFVIECKVLRRTLERTIAEGLEQTADYMDRCDAEAGHLVIFDRREDRPLAGQDISGSPSV